MQALALPALIVAFLVTVADAVPMTTGSNALIHSINVEVNSAALENVASVRETLASFGETFSHGSTVEVEFSALEADSRRQLQSGSTILRVSYTVACGASCDQVNAALTTLSTDSTAGQAHAEALIAAINSVGATFGVSNAVVSTAAEVASTLSLPTTVSITIPSPTCETAADGTGLDADCFGHVMWAINTGIVGNPEWYTSLTPTSSFEEFQCHLFHLEGVDHCSYPPCDYTCPAAPAPAPTCETATQDAGVDTDCFEHVMWAITTGIVGNPEWYPNLTPASSFEDFQCHLFHLEGVDHCTYLPCGYTCPTTNADCETAADGTGMDTDCFGHVNWAMNTGIVGNPEWYPLLTAGTSTFEDFQCHLYYLEGVDHCDFLPCDYACPGGGGCETAVSGVGADQDCADHVDWAMNTGITGNPEWYPGLTPASPAEDFQCHLYYLDGVDHCDYLPCNHVCAVGPSCETAVSGAGADQDCADHVNWAMTTGITGNPEWYPELTNTSSFEEFQCHLYHLEGVDHCDYLPCSHVCRIGGGPAGGCETALQNAGADTDCFDHVMWAITTGIVGNPEWYPNLNASNATFEDFQCHLFNLEGVDHCVLPPCGVTC